jgi:hypothetical protein
MAEPLVIPEKTAWVTGQTHGRANYSWWQASREIRNIARNYRINLPKGTDLAAVKSFIDVVVQWDSVTSAYIGTRPWLGIKLNIKAISQVTDYVGNSAVEPNYVLVKVLDHISRDFKKIPLNDTEKTALDVLIAATGNRRLGVTPHFGGVAGSIPTP